MTSEVTVRLIVVEVFKLPDTPATVTVVVPVAAVGLAVSVNVLIEVVGFGLNAAVTPLGNPVALNVTLPVKPSSGTTVIVLVPPVPCMMLNEDGLAVSSKFGVPVQLLKMNDAMFVLQSNVPVTAWY